MSELLKLYQLKYCGSSDVIWTELTKQFFIYIAAFLGNEAKKAWNVFIILYYICSNTCLKSSRIFHHYSWHSIFRFGNSSKSTLRTEFIQELSVMLTNILARSHFSDGAKVSILSHFYRKKYDPNRRKGICSTSTYASLKLI